MARKDKREPVTYRAAAVHVRHGRSLDVSHEKTRRPVGSIPRRVKDWR